MKTVVCRHHLALPEGDKNAPKPVNSHWKFINLLLMIMSFYEDDLIEFNVLHPQTTTCKITVNDGNVSFSDLLEKIFYAGFVVDQTSISSTL